MNRAKNQKIKLKTKKNETALSSDQSQRLLPVTKLLSYWTTAVFFTLIGIIKKTY